MNHSSSDTALERKIADEQRLENLEQRRQKLETEVANRRAKINDNLRRVRKRLSKRERKRATQRLIIRGRFYDHVIKRLVSNPPDCVVASPEFQAWLDAAFDAFVTRADLRALFDLPPLDKPGTPSTSSTAAAAPASSRDDLSFDNSNAHKPRLSPASGFRRFLDRLSSLTRRFHRQRNTPS